MWQRKEIIQKGGMINFSKSKIFLICCIVFIVGIAVVSFLPLSVAQNDIWWFSGIMISVVLLILFWKNNIVRIIALVGLFLFLAFWRYAIGLPENTANKIWYYNGQTITVVGKIINEPDIRQRNVKYIVNTKEIQSPKTDPRGLQARRPRGSVFGDWISVSGKILITTNLYPRYNYGDELEITCELQSPEPFSGFSYDRYLARFDIYSVCYYPRIASSPGPSPAVAGEGRNVGAWFYKKIFSLKNKFREIIDYGLTEPESSLARAIILGDKKGIPDDLRDKFSKTGVSHIVAISGMHISILAGLVMVMLLGLGLWRKYAFYFASVFLIVYIILIGLPASAMRAGLMGFLILWALNLGRLNKLTNSLVLAAVILLLINPKLLRDDIGFQLSFLAVLGIAHVYPLLNNLFDKLRFREPLKALGTFSKGVRDIFNITIAAQVFTLPIIALNFSQVSIIAPATNLLILWTLPILMVAVLVAILLSLLIPSVSFIFFLPAKLLLKYIILVVELLTRVLYAYLEIDYLWWGWAVLYYGIIIWIIYAVKKRK